MSEGTKSLIEGIVGRLLARYSRKAINFDLDTVALIAATGKKDTREAYTLLRTALENHGFVHRQYSGYLSRKAMSFDEAFAALDSVSMELPWFQGCIKECDVTMVAGDNLSYKRFLTMRSGLTAPGRTAIRDKIEERAVVADALESDYPPGDKRPYVLQDIARSYDGVAAVLHELRLKDYYGPGGPGGR